MGVEQRGTAAQGQTGFLAGGDDVGAKAGALGDAGGELGAIFSAQASRASRVRAMAASDNTPLALSPSPSRVTREKASITLKPPP
jgi:hypothetical protein